MNKKKFKNKRTKRKVFKDPNKLINIEAKVKQMFYFCLKHYESLATDERELLDKAYRTTQVNEQLTPKQLAFLKIIYEKVKKMPKVQH